MKVLITGHKGFVGRHFAERFENVRGIDIKEGKDCRDFFKTNNDSFELVVHCAAVVGGRALIEGNPLAVATDLSIDSEFFNWVKRTGQGRVVYFSSSAVYPVSLQTKPHKLKESDINLGDIKNPDMTYGLSKLVGEMLCKYVDKVYVFRPFSGYGKDQDLTYPFPSFISRIKRKENPFIIWGDGEQVRDFVHIDDIVDCVLEAIKQDISFPVNITSGTPTSFNELARKMFEISGFKPEVKHLSEKPVGVKYRCGDPTLMNTFYKPRVSLEEGILRSL